MTAMLAIERTEDDTLVALRSMSAMTLPDGRRIGSPAAGQVWGEYRLAPVVRHDPVPPHNDKYALAPGDRIGVAASTGIVQGALTVGAILVANNPGFRPRGVWQAGVGYDPNDVVSRDGVAYAAINSATDEPPPSPNWMQFGAKGDPGDLTSTATAELQVGYTTQVHTLSSGPTVVPSFADGALQALVATTATSIDVPVLGSGVMEIEVDNTGGHGVATTGTFAAVTGVPPAAGIGRLTVTRFATRTYGDWQ